MPSKLVTRKALARATAPKVRDLQALLDALNGEAQVGEWAGFDPSRHASHKALRAVLVDLAELAKLLRIENHDGAAVNVGGVFDRYVSTSPMDGDGTEGAPARVAFALAMRSLFVLFVFDDRYGGYTRLTDCACGRWFVALDDRQTSCRVECRPSSLPTPRTGHRARK